MIPGRAQPVSKGKNVASPPEISILLPTRERLSQVSRFLNSAADTADHPDRLEVVLYVDRDDELSHTIEHSHLKLVKLIRTRAKMGVMAQTCYENSTGRHVMLLNDDAVCRTRGWDTAVLQTFAGFTDGVALVWCNDLYRKHLIPVFPTLSRRTCELLGGICPPDYSHDCIDAHLFDIFKKLEALGHQRLVYLHEMVLEHMHHEVDKAEFDQIYDKGSRVRDELAFIAWDEQRQMIAEALARHIAREAECNS